MSSALGWARPANAGIRTKLVLFLTGVALLPLLGALAAIVLGGRELRLEAVRQMLLTVAEAEADSLQSDLAGDAQQLQVVLNDPELVRALASRDERLPRSETDALDRAWPDLPEEGTLLAKTLAGPGADSLRFLQGTNPHFAEIFITDRHGQLVSATNRTTDFYQADEDWWREAFNGGKGLIVIPPISYDASSQVWSIDICMPVKRDDQLVGIAKAVVDVSLWLGELTRSVGRIQASLMLATEDGRVVYREGFEPLRQRADQWDEGISRKAGSFFRVTSKGEAQAIVPVAIDREQLSQDVAMRRWFLVLYTGAEEVFGAIYFLSMLALGCGLALIVLLFLGGLYLIDRHITRRVLRIADAARRVAGGDLQSRVGPESRGAPPRRGDEIEDLRLDFNHMVEQVERSYRRLEAADKLRRSFLSVAGHELRTPISYIIGMAKLLKHCRDPDRLNDAVQSLGAKAERLNTIVQAMFKLMPEGGLPQHLQLSEVDVASLLADVRSGILPFLQERSQRLELLVPPGLQPFEADRERLHDVIENLVTNAIKFTPDGGEIRISAAEPDDQHVALEVADQGPGIPEEELPHLFQPFFSGFDVLRHSSGQSGYQKRGMGLGLAIVKYFVELHGGSVGVATSPRGSAFTVVLPRRPAGA